MPYRRLPNTDAARIKALQTAISKASSEDFPDIPLSIKTLSDAKSVSLKFGRLCERYRQTYEMQVKANKSFQKSIRNAKMYLSHFVQVLYMCVMRNEIKRSNLELYGLENANMVVPDLNAHEQLLDWGEKIIYGETTRVRKGGVPIFNPTIAKVNVMYAVFKEDYQTQKIHQKATSRILKEVSEYRQSVDEVIFNIWEEVEKHNLALSLPVRLEKNRAYGVLYYYRKGETIE